MRGIESDVGTLVAAAAAVLLPLLPGCSAGLSEDGEIRHTIGRATLRDVLVEVPDVLRDSGYTINDDRRTERTVSFETDWRQRAPFDDEASQGVSAARTRLTLHARKSGPDAYTLRIRAENEVQGMPGAADWSGTEWSPMAATRMYQDYIRELWTEIQLRVDAGVRIH